MFSNKTDPETKSASVSSFNNGADANLEEALRRSLADQSGSSNGGGKKDLLKPGGSKQSPGNEKVEKISPSQKRPHSPYPPTSGKKPAPKLTLIQRRLDASEPSRFLLSKVQDCPDSHRDSYSIFLADLLCSYLGPISASLQINFMVELDFITMCYEVHKKAVHISHPGT